MSQMKEQDRILTRSKWKRGYNKLDGEFKIRAIKILTGLEKRVGAHRETLSKEKQRTNQ